jgi:PH (Pleckstrin Homology) domain-containing protein
MTHKSKLEVWHYAAIAYTLAVLALGGNPWIGVPVLICLLYMAVPHRYVTAPDALRVSAGLVRWTIPYPAITCVGTLGNRVAIRVGRAPELLLAPDNPDAFLSELRKHVQIGD